MNQIIFKDFFFFLILGCAGSSSLCGAFSSCSEWELLCGGVRLSPYVPSLIVKPGCQEQGLQQLRVGSVVVAHGLSRSMTCGIFWCPLHCKADS